MNMRWLAAVTIGLCGFCLEPANACPAVEDKEVLCFQFDPNNSFTVKTPEGWVNSPEVARSGKVNAAFYPKGGSWQNSEAVMYANSSAKKPNQTLEDFIKSDAKEFKDFKISDYKAVTLPSNKKAVIKRFDYAMSKELIAYIEEEKYFAMIVLSARSEKALFTHEQAFNTLLQSYTHTSDKLSIKTP